MHLERSQMLEVEGAGEGKCRRILRHASGHCLNEAYRRARFDLRRIFPDRATGPEMFPATCLLRRKRALLRMRIAEGTGVRAYTVDQLLRQMIARPQILGRVNDPEDVTLERLLVLLTMQTARFVHVGFPKVAL